MMIIADDDVRGDLHPWATCTLGRPAPLGDLHPWATCTHDDDGGGDDDGNDADRQ